MAKPAWKADNIEAMLTALTGKHRPTEIEADRCVLCGEDAKVFKDALSEKEYTISGQCQACQDKVWGGK